ncbi:MAG: glutamate synthase subunit beta [Spirochaetota bacterium]
MGKPTGFLEYTRIKEPYREIKERLKDYREVINKLPPEVLRTQAARCMDCGIPYCHALGCPVSNLIPEWNDAVYRGHWKEAFERLEYTNNLPEITGRICPALCEAACTLSINDSPVTIRQLELAIIEKAFQEGWVEPKPPRHSTGKSAAVIGSGPAGLSAAQLLRRAGHRVTIFEKSDRLGGLLRYGIPDFKLEKWVLDRRLAQLEAEGVEFETNVIAGEDISAGYLKRKFDVILIASGAGKPRELPAQGTGFEGIHFALDYLTQSNKFVAGDLKEYEIISARDKNVLVLGGGDTGADCIGTANRQGAKKVFQYEILPKPREWEEPYNPDWPEWPRILRTSSSHVEGCHREWGIETVRFTGRGIQLEEAHFRRVKWNFTPGKAPRMEGIPGSEFSLKVDLVLLALGFLHTEHTSLLKNLGLAFDEQGNIKTNSRYATSVSGVFAAGDANTGASLVVRAMYHGKNAAEAINDYLL